jgi:hypothetical protein
MSALFTFNLSDLTAGLTDANQWKWWGPCKADIEGTSLDRLKAILTVEHISECDLRSRHVAANFDINHPAAIELEQNLSKAQTEDTTDAMILTQWGETKWEDLTIPEGLGITIGLRPQRYEHFRTFITLNFGRADLIGRISFSFVGFPPERSEGSLVLPSLTEFRNGRPYLVIADASLTFSSGPVKS